jgi:predicted DNA-binding transcriptional regulator AlpA
MNATTNKPETGLKRPEFKNQTEPDILPRMAFSMAETATILGLSYQTVYRLNKRGLLKSSSALRHKLFPKAEIERFLRS